MKKISVGTAKAYLKQAAEPEWELYRTITVKDKEAEVMVRNNPTPTEISAFVSAVTDSCFVDGEFHYESLESAAKVFYIQMFTNVNVIPGKEDGMYVDIDSTCALFDALEFYDEFREMKELAEKSAIYKAGRKGNKTEEVLDKLSEFMDVLNKKVDGLDFSEMMKYAGQLSKATEQLEEDSILNGLIKVFHKEE